MEEKRSITVEIYGTPYRIRATEEANAKHIQMVAAEVDSQMKKIAEANPRLDLPRLAVLAAVNVADQMYRLRSDMDKHVMKNEINQSQVKEELAELKRQYDELAAAHDKLLQADAKRGERERELQHRLEHAEQEWADRLAATERDLHTELEDAKRQLQMTRAELEQERQAHKAKQQGESEQELAYRKLKEDYEKLQNEFNEWIQLAEQVQPGHQ